MIQRVRLLQLSRPVTEGSLAELKFIELEHLHCFAVQMALELARSFVLSEDYEIQIRKVGVKDT
jgi:hypothetical protein